MKRLLPKTGFTLLELVVVVALIGGAATLGGTMLLKVISCWDQVSSRAELDSSADHAFEIIGMDIADLLAAKTSGVGMVGLVQTTHDEKIAPNAELADDTLVLPLRTSAGTHPVAAGARVIYRIERDNGRHLLVRTVGDLTTEMPIGGRIELMPNADVLQLRVEFAGRDGVWQKSATGEGWFEAKQMPSAIRVTLVIADATSGSEQITRSKVLPIHVD